MSNVQLVGPITGMPDYNQLAFANAKARWEAGGHDVTNPLENFDGRKDLPWETYLGLCVKQIADCDAVAVLEGWEKSRGSKLELHVAKALGKEIYDADTMQPLELDSVHALPDSILDEAKRLVHGARQESYGHPSEDFARTAGMWHALFGWDVDPHQVAMAMICVKLSRMVETPCKPDHYADSAGYSECAWMCVKATRQT
jgi:hypothetical protein